MKKALTLILAVIIVISATACGKTTNKGKMTLVIGAETPVSYEVEIDEATTEKGLFSVLEALKEKEGLEYEEAGGFINSVEGIEIAEGEYIYIFTSNEADFDVSEYATEMEYEGTRLVSSGVGAEQMHISEGTIIYIGKITF